MYLEILSAGNSLKKEVPVKYLKTQARLKSEQIPQHLTFQLVRMPPATKRKIETLLLPLLFLPLTLEEALGPNHAKQLFQRRRWGRKKLILKCYCTKIVTESAESVFIMQNASKHDWMFGRRETRIEWKKPSENQPSPKIYSEK